MSRAALAYSTNKVKEAIRSELAAYQQVAGSKSASELGSFLNSNEFLSICEQVFHQVDVDKSRTIDPSELGSAFEIVMKELPGVSDAVDRLAKSKHQGNTKAMAAELAQQAFNTLDVDKSGFLDEGEFVNACKLIWIKALTLSSTKTSGDKIVEAALADLKDMMGEVTVDELCKLFNSFDFSNLCTTVFNNVDVDGSKSIDESECLEAFKLLAKEQLSSLPAFAKGDAAFSQFLNDVSAESVKEVFAHLDNDKSGALDETEFPSAVMLIWIDLYKRRHQATHGKTNDMVSRALAKAKPVLSKEHLQLLEEVFSSASFENDCTSAFHKVDLDGSHSLDRKELLLAFRGLLRSTGQADKLLDSGVDLQALLREVGSSVVDKVFAIADTDVSGTIEVGEFPAVAQLFWILVLRVSAMGGDSAAVDLLDDDDNADTAATSTSSSSTSSSEAKEHKEAVLVVQGENDAESGAGVKRKQGDAEEDENGDDAWTKRARTITSDPLVQQLLGEKVEAGETEEEQNRLQAEAQALFDLMGSSMFESACMEAFAAVDADGSGAIDREEMGEAFKMLLEKVPGAEDNLRKLGVETEEDMQEAMKQLVAGVFDLLGVADDGSSLNKEQFSTALRLMWIKLS